SAQPTSNTFLTTKVRTKFPFLLKYPLREYQHIGLDWLVTMYEKRLNGILADEMGLGKTIMTIALLAHLACEKGIWGPHLIVVPTSVMLNWETEFLKWCPAFKILTYFGSAKERKIKRQGWMKPNSFHMCITTYRLVIQDSKIFKRKKWKYLILDEAHLIKNWKSQRWQTLLNFNSKRRILLTGTPLQNDLMELWSLMHFLMPHVFQSHQEFKDWFSNPISGMVEGQEKINKEVVDRLHNVLRPFILRRLKRDVEKQLPMKLEHVVYCRLSKRQRNLYEDFIASSETQATLASSNFFGMISVIMQLRKVCNHPDLFEGRPIVSSFDMNGIDIQLSSSICSILTPDPFSTVDLSGFGFLFTHLNFSMTSWESEEVQAIATPSRLIEGRADLVNVDDIEPGLKHRKNLPGTNIFEEIRKALLEERLRQAKERVASIAWWNSLRCRKTPIYSTNLQDLVTVCHPVYDLQFQKRNSLSNLNSSKLADIVLSPVERFQKMIDLVESFMFAIPAARAPPPLCWCSKSDTFVFLHPTYKERCTEILSPCLTPLRPAIVRRQLYFPDRRLIQFDCGKLQELSVLLRRLKSEGHRALIFTQMTKMLDILEAFINL
ncbi:Protein PHOTOPERIOD-INDEPENDENT EARLY FLOWERING like, partial [Actinidia chinensis var. chinensis]